MPFISGPVGSGPWVTSGTMTWSGLVWCGGLGSGAVVGPLGHDVTSPADAAVRSVSVDAAGVHTLRRRAAFLTLVNICREMHSG